MKDAGADGRGIFVVVDVDIVDDFFSLIEFYWCFRQWQTGTTQARQRVTLGQAWVFDQRTESRGLIRKQTIVQTGVNRVQTARR